MKVPIDIEVTDDGLFVARVPGMSLFEGVGESPEEAVQEVVDWASLYLECKEPELIEFKVRDARFYPGSGDELPD